MTGDLAGVVVSVLSGPASFEVALWVAVTTVGVLVYAVVFRFLRKVDGGQAQARAVAAATATPHHDLVHLEPGSIVPGPASAPELPARGAHVHVRSGSVRRP
jgi:hypothetical protein